MHPSLLWEYPRMWWLSDEMSERWLSQLRPLPAGVYGVRVLPGPHWLSSGFAGQNERSFGWVRPAGELTLQSWAGDAWEIGNLECPHCGCLYHQLGGWHPSRSAVVEWQIPSGVVISYYKAGDEGDYDLYYHPEDLELPGAGFDTEALRRACASFEEWHAGFSGSPELSRAISCCEACHHSDPALRQLASGASLQEVGENCFMHLRADAAVPRVLGRRVAPALAWRLRVAASAA